MKVSNSSRIQFTGFERYIGNSTDIVTITAEKILAGGKQPIAVVKRGDYYVATGEEAQLLLDAKSVADRLIKIPSSAEVSLGYPINLSNQLCGLIGDFFINRLNLTAKN